MHTPRRLLVTGAAFALVGGLAACGDDANTASPDDETIEAAEGEEPTIEVATDDEYGDYLVDADGLTLYIFTQDEGSTSACTSDECVGLWPPIAAETPVAGDDVDGEALGTADALDPDQVTYHDQLLYYFAGDQAPGDITGTSIDDWYPIDPDGTVLDAGVEDEVDDRGSEDEIGY